MEAEERLKLNKIKKLYDDLQLEAIRSLHDEQKFYGDVAYANWSNSKELKKTEVKSFSSPDDDLKAIEGYLITKNIWKDNILSLNS